MTRYLYYPNDALKVAKPIWGPTGSTTMPAMWDLTPEKVDPHWRHFYDDLWSFVPMWNYGDQFVREYAPDYKAQYPTYAFTSGYEPTWGQGRWGTRLVFDLDGANPSDWIDTNRLPAAGSPFTIMACINPTGYPASDNWCLGLGSQNGANLNITSSGHVSTWSGAASCGHDHVSDGAPFVGAIAKGVGPETNGTLTAYCHLGQSGSSHQGGTYAGEYWIGGYPGSTTDYDYTGDIYWAAVWLKRQPDSFIRQCIGDPFGMLRRAR